MRGRAIAVALLALVVLALVAVVAVAATGTTPSGSGVSRAPSKSLLDTVFTLYLIAIVAGGVLLVYGLAQRQAIAREVATGRYRRFSLVSLLFLLGVFTALTYRGLTHWKPPASPDEISDPAFPGATPFPTTPDQEQTVPYQPSVSWLPSPGRRPRRRGRRRVRRRGPSRAPATGGGPRRSTFTRPGRHGSTTCGPSRIRAARSSPRTLGWSGCSRRTASAESPPRTSEEYLHRGPDRPHPPLRWRRTPDGSLHTG